MASEAPGASSNKSLEEFVRFRTPAWLSKLLKVTLEDVPLEELFANCWVLGRVADVIQGLLDGVPYHSPSPQLSERPSRAVMSDMDHFNAICETLDIDPDSRIDLAEVESRTSSSAERVALCLWDIADALRHRGFESVPEFAPAEDFVQLRNAVPRETNRSMVAMYENGSGGASPTSPQDAAPKRPVIPLLPLDSSPAMAKQRAKAAAPSTPQDRKKKISSSSSSSLQKKKAPDPPSLHHWLPGDTSSSGGASSNAAAEALAREREKSKAAATGSPTVIAGPVLASTQTTPGSIGGAFLPPASAPQVGSGDGERDLRGLGGEDSSSAASTDILASILSPEKNKPAHTQVINALMRSDTGDEEQQAQQQHPPRGKRSLGLAVEGAAVVGGGGSLSRNGSGRSAGSRGDSRNFVGVIGGSSSSNGSGSGGKQAGNGRRKNGKLRGGNRWWTFPRAVAAGAALALIVGAAFGAASAGGKKKGGKKEERNQPPVRHAGRW